MIFSRRSRSRQGGFDMTPMIDVVLQLIIFFLYTAHFTSMTRAPVDLPKEPGEEVVEAGAGTIVIDVDSEGRMTHERARVDLDGIERVVRAELSRTGDPAGVRVLVRADRDLPASTVNELARRLGRLGVRQWRLGTADQGG